MNDKKKIPNAGPFRYIRKSDRKCKFSNELQELNDVDLEYLLTKNKGKKQAV